uniref:Katanin p60 ATPase-containing subunit A-like 2 n=1 Tax=Phallusia mammillata TaxID=59560 RepID=A0A6F9DFJ4_9ASCI|nr:katanin p60 ATPase-containing subunit A-like 2 [Phallusia mammillata]
MALELSYQSIKTANSVRESEDQRQESRKRNLLILILSHLTDNGYLETAASLEKEGNISLNRWQVCDNIDLDNILQEYESYYYIKFQKNPKITRKLTTSADTNKSRINRTRRLASNPTNDTTSLPRISNGNQSAPAGRGRRPGSGGDSKKKNVTSRTTTDYSRQNSTISESSAPDSVSVKASDLGLTVSSVGIREEKKNEKCRKEIVDVGSMLRDAIRGASNDIPMHSSSEPRLVKPLGGFVGFNHEMRELATVISRDIYLQDPNVKWSDIVGLDHAKCLVKEAVVYPIKYPQLFTGILSPWKGILLYGPPGTGKTMLAKAVATECNTTFFNISASTIVSKWRGDSEKLVRVLFELARFHAPSTIFLDELESVMSQRGSGPGGEHEGSRRMKTELLVQMDGLSRSDDLVFVLAASNLPWELDHAMLRRLEKRIIVDLPKEDARESMFRRFLPPCNKEGGLVINTRLDYTKLAENTEGYSGSDLKLVCKESAMRVVRKIFHALEEHKDGEQLPDFALETITTSDVLDVLNHTKPASGKLTHKYLEWKTKYESV